MTLPSDERHNQLINKYFIPNMGGYSAVGSELSLILDRLDTNKTLSAKDKQWIKDKGLFDLNEFVKKLEETGRADFRIIRAKFERQQNKTMRRELWEKYDINYIESCDVPKMIKTLLRLEEGNRLPEKDVLWFSTNDYFSEYPEIRRKFHENEAKFYHKSFKQNKDPWQAVNASSHYRKANFPTDALELLNTIDLVAQRNKQIKAALCTTKGGCMRDLHKIADALKLAESAYSFDSNSFHPCTLLGALNYEIGNYILGDEWFAKAVERGADMDSVDHELRYIFTRADKNKQEELKRHLLSIDSNRYGWVNSKNLKKRRCK